MLALSKFYIYLLMLYIIHIYEFTSGNLRSDEGGLQFKS